MKTEKNRSVSLIDGTTEHQSVPTTPEFRKRLVPVYGEKQVLVQTLDGEELVTQQIIIGFEEEGSLR